MILVLSKKRNMLGIMGVFNDCGFSKMFMVGVNHMFFESSFEGSTCFTYVRHSIGERDFIDSGTHGDFT